MAGKTYVAKQETSEAIQTDTTAIRNTLGDFSGGGIEDNVVNKLGSLYNLVAKVNSGFAPSDNILKIVLTSEVSNSTSTSAEIGTFIPKLSGMLRIKCSLRANNSLSQSTKGVKVSNGSAVVGELRPTALGSYSDVQIDIPVIKDVAYTLSIEKAYMTQGTSCNYCSVCGTVALPDAEVIE